MHTSKNKAQLHCVLRPDEASVSHEKLSCPQSSLSPQPVAAASPRTSREKQNRLPSHVATTWTAQRLAKGRRCHFSMARLYIEPEIPQSQPIQGAGGGESRAGSLSAVGLLCQEAPVCQCAATSAPCLTGPRHMAGKEPQL